jgi:hypothetical protein
MDGKHPNDEALLALLDGEVPAAARGDLDAHLAACPECSGRLDELRFMARRVTGALESIDVGSPWTDVPPELAAAARGRPTPITSARSSRRRVGRRSVAAAASLVFVLAAGAYAVPGSPIRDLVTRSALAVSSWFGSDTDPDDGPSAVSVEPVDGAVSIRVNGATSRLRITVRRGSTRAATVSALDSGRFQVESGIIEVTAEAGRLEIELPEGILATVEVDGVVVATQTGRLLARAPAADESPATILVETAG